MIDHNHRNARRERRRRLGIGIVAFGLGLALAAPLSLATDVGTLIDFTSGTPALAAEVNQNFDDVRTAVNSKEDQVTRTRVRFAGSTTIPALTGTFVKLRDAGSFTKRSSTSTLVLHWAGHARHIGSVGDFVHYELRVNGTRGNNVGAVFYLSNATDNVQIGMTSLIEGVDAGNQTVEIWIRGSADGGTYNLGNFGQHVIVEESEPS
jgi:hypothetical protein